MGSVNRNIDFYGLNFSAVQKYRGAYRNFDV